MKTLFSVLAIISLILLLASGSYCFWFYGWPSIGINTSIFAPGNITGNISPNITENMTGNLTPENITVNISPNITENLSVPNATVPEQVEEQPLGPQNFTYQYWSKDTSYNINLTAHFYDPDNDILEYSFYPDPLENITVNIVDGIATLTPDKGWYGMRNVTFVASDPLGANVSSPIITLHVLNRNGTEQMTITWKDDWKSIKDFFKVYGIYFIIGIVLLIIIIVYVSMEEKKISQANVPKKRKTK